MRILAFAGTLFAGVVGCVEPPDEPTLDDTSQEVATDNGTSLNGTSLNGTSLNGTSLNGTSLNGTSLNGMSFNGTSLNGSSLNDTSLSGAQLIDSSWIGTTSSGATVKLRIDSVTSGAGDNRDVNMYGVSYETTSGWLPLCGAGVLAVVVPGVWNTQQGVAGGGAYSPSTTRLTFACRGKSIAKCVELGYKPWLGRIAQLTSCVRLLRGDYCGDGRSHTTDGQLVNLYDSLGVQADTEAWPAEAEWTPNGARCIASKRDTRFSQLGAAQPWCIGSKAVPVTSACAVSFRYGAVLISELHVPAGEPTSNQRTR